MEKEGGLEVVDLSEEDREGEEGATKISLGGTPTGAALALAATAASADEDDEEPLADEDDEELESEAAWSSVDGASLLSDGADSASAASAVSSRLHPLRRVPGPRRTMRS